MSLVVAVAQGSEQPGPAGVDRTDTRTAHNFFVELLGDVWIENTCTSFLRLVRASEVRSLGDFVWPGHSQLPVRPFFLVLAVVRLVQLLDQRPDAGELGPDAWGHFDALHGVRNFLLELSLADLEVLDGGLEARLSRGGLFVERLLELAALGFELVRAEVLSLSLSAGFRALDRGKCRTPRFGSAL